MIPAVEVNEPRTDSARDPWSSWAKVVDLPAPKEPAAMDAPAEVVVEEPAEDTPAPDVDVAAALARLVVELADERRQRAVAEETRQEAETRLHAAEVAAARISAEVTAARARITELERDR